ncbi:hypothetical protein KKC1_24320 [Calderihabitans maritimus]|uniref:NAD-dependent epimerase/dehydratase domain-containing protein n=1 Tax=Calderihabitans maritimus TaxID=1246530 RepID=A0A1Z5HVD9_9FIRM|nr:SDR family oxidoreductase [Calderihabitans maritimus]GAW93295.1 hypothetical protein KKC1_24320 [Calderihabitans maritimus]
MKYLVTGGAGFIGSHIVEALLREGFFVRVLDNFSTGSVANLRHCREDVELIVGDVRDLATVQKAVRGMDFVLHQAALPSVPRSVANPRESNDNNVTGTLNVLVAAREAGVRRVIYASSSSVYGETPQLPKEESMQPLPLSPYAVSKYTGELYCRVFYTLYGLETISLRYFNVFGPRQNPDSQYAPVIPKFVTAMLEDRSPVIFGDGLQSRDFTYIDNVVKANLLACRAKKTAGEAVNIACGMQINLNQVVAELNRLLGKNIPAIYSEPRPGDVKHSYADISRACELLNYRPETSFRQGLEYTVQWFRQQLKL